MSDKKLLQLSSNKRDFATQEFEGNLRAILLNINTVASDTSSSNVYRDVDERKRLINDCITRKRKAGSSSDQNQYGKRHQMEKPGLVGKQILHKWVIEEEDKWIPDSVLKVYGNIDDINCEFEVKYEDETEPLLVNLYEDLQNGDLVMM